VSFTQVPGGLMKLLLHQLKILSNLIKANMYPHSSKFIASIWKVYNWCDRNEQRKTDIKQTK